MQNDAFLEALRQRLLAAAQLREQKGSREPVCTAQRSQALPEENAFFGDIFAMLAPKEMERAAKPKAPGFHDTLFSMIDRLGKSDVEVYRGAQMDRRLFSKIRSDVNYHPSKQTVLALGLGMKLTRNDMDALLGSAGYLLSDSLQLDTAVLFCMERGVFDVMEVNEVLDYFGLPLL